MYLLLFCCCDKIQGNLWKKEFIWAYSSEGDDGLSWQWGMAVSNKHGGKRRKQGGHNSTTNTKQGEQTGEQGYEPSKPFS